ncbi:MAG: hypothetical protein R3358_11325, partial [Woeseiaceae bacterium]|nr:hypothetical protein [Woeseiaceae bacterium]
MLWSAALADTKDTALQESPAVAAGSEIGTITIVRDNVFDPDDPKESGAFYQFFNRFHIVTRERIIRR